MSSSFVPSGRYVATSKNPGAVEQEQSPFGRAVFMARFALNDMLSVAMGNKIDDYADPRPTQQQLIQSHNLYQKAMLKQYDGGLEPKSIDDILNASARIRPEVMTILSKIEA